ncbi:hypothetical protein [uncultured Thiohalocapsa sp.]|uniref:ImmA/IrrE family metallo-endopeptidase n=1 Tax=uncultured Thiohalocapsa sp. TaxID=768990 RepID=UPI0025DBB110|nr:hypothetical protein [uncultured Thiohalocapsa sp.]
MTTVVKDGKPTSPSGYKVAPQSYKSLEGIARSLLGHLPLEHGELYRLDCKELLEGTLLEAGYRFRCLEVHALEDCAAFTVPAQSLIVMREDIYDHLCADQVYGRSTVVHETSHLVLRHDVTLHRGAALRQHRFCEDSEWQAKALTAAIMMPLEACQRASGPLELSQMCGTSVEAATYRLHNVEKHGLLSPNRRPGAQRYHAVA